MIQPQKAIDDCDDHMTREVITPKTKNIPQVKEERKEQLRQDCTRRLEGPFRDGTFKEFCEGAGSVLRKLEEALRQDKRKANGWQANIVPTSLSGLGCRNVQRLDKVIRGCKNIHISRQYRVS